MIGTMPVVACDGCLKQEILLEEKQVPNDWAQVRFGESNYAQSQIEFHYCPNCFKKMMKGLIK